MANKKNSEKQQKTKAQQAIGKTSEERRVETRNQLVARLVGGILLAFLALFLLLSMFGIHAALLDLFRDGARGLLGYGYWLLPWAFGMIAWLLVFKNHEPALLRSVSILMVVALFSGLLHGILCRTTFDEQIVATLWRTGIDGASGGLLPGLLAQGLIFCFSRGGAIPVMLLLLIVFVFLAFRISAAQLLHKRADKRREQLKALEQEEKPEPIILTHEDTMEDLRVLATPPTIKRPELRLPVRRQESFDIPVENDTDRPEAPALDQEEDLVFFGSKKKKQKKAEKQVNRFDVPVGQDYTAQVQELVDAQYDQEEPEAELMELPWELPQPIAAEIPTAAAEKPETLTEAELTEAAKEAMKDSKVSKDEAALAAAQVAMEIEAKTDQEAQEAPVYQYPPMTMLQEAMSAKEDNTEEMRTNVVKLEATLKSFGVDIKIENVVRGPTVTRYEMELKPGVKMNKITSLHEDIALALGVSGIRVAAVPGKSSIIGIEVPNKITTSVPIREVLSSKEFRNHKSNLAFAVGKDIGGNYIIGDIAKMPHLLIAGTTGSGKSVCMNSIIVSLLYRATPEQVRLIMIDPKVVELSIYNGIPHLLIPVVTDAKKAAGALQWAVTEMERRYKLLADYKVRDLSGYNKLAQSDPNMAPMPQIVVIIDELADLMLVAAKEVENSIVRIAQKARAAGMYLVIATQRPSSDVITGLMKANIPSRIAFAVASAIDSRIILDESGAEKLVGKGDMLYGPLGSGKPKRVQGCFITDEEVEEVAEFVKSSSDSDYSDEILKEIEQNATSSSSGSGKADSDGDQMALELDGDELLPDAVEVILDTKQASVSMLQRRLKLGYAHAARIVDEMEEKGIVGPFEGSKPRQLLITREQWDTMVGINPRAKAPEAAQEPVPEEADDPPFDL
jgi:S-DNA-T family DNA segregation ATPase FtsK/SpoIIIE